MKKFLLIILLLSCTLYSADVFKHVDVDKWKIKYPYLENFQQQGRILFFVKAKGYYEFTFPLNKGQYCFMFQGNNGFIQTITEPSGFQSDPIDSYIFDQSSIRFENVMERGIYKIVIYSLTNNAVEIIYGTY